MTYRVINKTYGLYTSFARGASVDDRLQAVVTLEWRVIRKHHTLIFVGIHCVANFGRNYIREEETTMKSSKRDFGVAAIISFILVLPLAILEALNNTVTKENVFGLLLLFGVLWLLPTAFIVILRSILRSARGNRLVANPITISLKIASLALIAMVWGWGLVDQLPCFLGIPNCD